MDSKNGKYHFLVSIVKSIIRILGCILGVVVPTYGLILLAIHLGVAEILGIVEELVDKRE